ncbi:SARP family transcriptional regulator [Frondihabitans sucicola]|uniref:SARP family transcriptional regulator n=1 Tax=Frondihabitans sucicola TaxID=1268041 RepID=A0ABM8GQI1_9MICO|nr:BTAD domain-containing putative transcriptional regulator [Frondihabitans sucicola]BDZ50717.1 SARP family transcriptional regulator [Frondihabitans sucicola]
MSTLVGLPVRVAVLGPVLVLGAAGNTLVEPPSARGKALVATLTLAGGESVSVPRLIDDLWGDTPPRAGKAALQTLISRLRQTCADDVIVSTAGGYALGNARASDLALASSALFDARRAAGDDAATAERVASDALQLWRGEPGADLAGTEPATELAGSAERLRADLLRVRALARFDTGDFAGTLADLDSLSGVALRDDDLIALRLRALDGSGRRTEALRVFAEFRERLADELGADPSPELVRLHTELLQDPAPRATATRLTIGLRQAPNALIGRDGDIARVEALLGESRLVTILGAGGLGKTRLAQEVGRRAAATTPGVVVVELAGVRAEEDVALALATTLGIREAKVGRLRLTDPAVRVDVRELILGALAERPTLLVVDNCEHVIGAAATWVADILASTTSVRVLATSRAPLSIGAERVHPLQPLGSAAGGFGDDDAAVRLFHERARAARPGVVLPGEAVARLCRRLDGLPLAIELAAARIRSMSVDEIERRLGNRFALLTGGDRSAPERHRTLTAVIDWSWNLLGVGEQTLLRRLSSFPDGFSAAAAQAVGGDSDDDVTDALDGLVTQSLVAVTEDAPSGALRYRMLETVREFGDRELVLADEVELVRDGMFRWAETFCGTTMERLDGSQQLDAFAAMALEQDNLATVLRRALDEQRADTCVTVFATLGYFWSLRGNQSDVASFGSVVLAVSRRYEPDEAHTPATALTFALAGSIGLFSDRRVGYVAIARLRKIRAGAVILPERLRAMVDILLAAIRGMDAMGELLPRFAGSPDPVIAEIGLILGAQTFENRGRVARAIADTESAYASAVEHGHVWAAATAASFLTQLYAQSGDPEAALVWAIRGRDGLEAIGARSDLQELGRRTAAAEVSLGRFDSARAIFDDILTGEEDIQGPDREDIRLIASTGLAEIAHREGRGAESLAGYDAAVADLWQSPGGWDRRRWPQLILSSAAALAAHATRETVASTPAEVDALATSSACASSRCNDFGRGSTTHPSPGREPSPSAPGCSGPLARHPKTSVSSGSVSCPWRPRSIPARNSDRSRPSRCWPPSTRGSAASPFGPPGTKPRTPARRRPSRGCARCSPTGG